MKRVSQSSAFTLVEILAALSIVLVLGALAAPVVGKIGESSKETQCVSRLRALGAAVQAFAADHSGMLPTNTKHNPFDPADTDLTVASTKGRMYNLLGPYVLVEKVAGESYSEEKVFRCPSLDKIAPENFSRYLYKYNDLITRNDGTGTIRDILAAPIRQVLVARPNETPFAWDVSGDTGAGSNTFAAHSRATKFGYSGPTSPLGLSPNHGRRCNILFVSGRVAPADLSSLGNFPWNGKAPAKAPLETVFDPRYAGN